MAKTLWSFGHSECNIGLNIVKFLIAGTPKMITFIVLKVYCAVMHPKDADGMANSVDPEHSFMSTSILIGAVCSELPVPLPRVLQ